MHYNYIILLFKIFICLFSFFRMKFKLLAIAFKSHLCHGPCLLPHIYLSLHTLNTAYFLIVTHHLPMPNTSIFYPLEEPNYYRSSRTDACEMPICLVDKVGGRKCPWHSRESKIGRIVAITLSDGRLKEFLLNFQFPSQAMFSSSNDTVPPSSF